MARSAKSKELKKGKWYRVWWDDAAAASSGWKNEEEAAKDGGIESIVTVGKLIFIDERQVILAQSAGVVETDKEVLNTQAIPRGWITRFEELR